MVVWIRLHIVYVVSRIYIYIYAYSSTPRVPLSNHQGDKTALYVSTRLVKVIEETEQFIKYASLYTTAAAAAGTSNGKGKGRGTGTGTDDVGSNTAYVNTEEELDLLSKAMVQGRKLAYICDVCGFVDLWICGFAQW